MSSRLTKCVNWMLLIWLYFVTGCQPPHPRQQVETHTRLVRLAGETMSLVNIKHKLPVGGLHGLLRQLAEDGAFETYPGLEKGLDAWGREIILEAGADGIIRFRSKGPNGIDND